MRDNLFYRDNCLELDVIHMVFGCECIQVTGGALTSLRRWVAAGAPQLFSLVKAAKLRFCIIATLGKLF